MASQVDRRTLVRWLLAHDFQELPGKPGGHRRFIHRSPRLVITVPGHGPADLTKKHVGMILRSLEGIGFEREQIRIELAEL
jgi:predicted RNA binding protein YcfA (HicA-like mRNA interferase family)